MPLNDMIDSALADCLPQDADQACLLGRIWQPGVGPVLVTVHQGQVFDASGLALTCSELLAQPDAAGRLGAALARNSLPLVGPLGALLGNSAEHCRDTSRAWLLAPCDLQAIKASGVTFVASLLERVVEEQARGDAERARVLRDELQQILGHDLRDITPGSAQAEQVKQVLIARGAWSQYLEVGIGPDAEIFTKAPVLSAVGNGADVGILRASRWNNPEPEVVLVVNPAGEIVGATLGNDVNLRDFEGRSALLLGRAKDNNGSCAIGPFIRLFDAHFGLDDVRQLSISLQVQGADGYAFEGTGAMQGISRGLEDLVAHAMGPHHQYPDGMLLFLGTMLVPTADRLTQGQGFTHQVGDVVTVAAARLGRLCNRVDYSDAIAPWTFGIGALMANLRKRAAAH